MQAAYDLRSRSRLQPRLQPMHSGRPPLRPCTVPAKTSFSPRHTHTRIHDGGECQHNENTQTLPSRPIAPTVIPQFPRRLSVTSAEPAELVFRSSWPSPAARECPSFNRSKSIRFPPARAVLQDIGLVAVSGYQERCALAAIFCLSGPTTRS